MSRDPTCRLAWSDDAHVCVTSYGRPVHGDQACYVETARQIRERGGVPITDGFDLDAAYEARWVAWEDAQC